MISYEVLIRAMKEKGVGKTELSRELGLSSRTVAKIAKGEKLSGRSMQKIADYLSLPAEVLMREESSNRILQLLRDEKRMNLPGGLYHELQVRMTYNSNHMEGSKLSEDQTRYIFETSTVDVGDGIPVDDILETVHHFRAIDYVIDSAEAKLTEETNVIGGRETVKPSDVHARMKALLDSYNAKECVTIEDIVELHAEFEYIHPFQDGNGRVGRLVALKECLRHNIIPFIIEDSKKNFYYRGLNEWRNEKGWLTDTCQDGQDTFIRLLDMLDIPHE